MQKPQLIENSSVVTASGLVYRVRLPQGAGPHPTVVMLHGRSGNEDVMWVFARALPAHWLLIAPRAAQPDPRGGYSWDVRIPEDWSSYQSMLAPANAIQRLINALPAAYNADLEQVFLMGFSQGSSVALTTAIDFPGLVQGLALLVGFMPDESEAHLQTRANPLKDMPIFMALGRDDHLIPANRSYQCANHLIRAGAHLDFRAYDTGHKLNAQGMRDLKKWWLGRDKNS